jgi:hypothetical protein
MSSREGSTPFLDWNSTKAKAEFERAGELDPGNLDARGGLAFVEELTQARFDARLEYLRHITSIDPLDSAALWHLAWVLRAAPQVGLDLNMACGKSRNIGTSPSRQARDQQGGA